MADASNDIARYLNGEMSPAEMHELERKALEDPFLAEALEGLDAIEAGARQDDLSALQAALNKRVRPPASRMAQLWVWPARIAAGLLVAIIAGLFILKPFGKEGKEDLASQEQVPAAPEDQHEDKALLTDTMARGDNGYLAQAKPKEPKSSTSPGSAASGPGAKVETPEQPDTKTKTTALPVEPTPSAAVDSEELALLAEEEAQRGEAVEDRAPATERLQLAEAAPQQAKKETEPAAARSRQFARKLPAAGAPSNQAARDELATARMVRGVVTDETGVALPGVNVLIKGTNKGAVTDLTGHYQVAIDSPTTLVYSYIGYVEKEIQTDQRKAIDVTMHTDVSELSEVVVMAYDPEENIDPTMSNFEFASPEGGQRAYKQYLVNNIQYPQIALDNGVEGKVTVQFTVEPTGQLSDFRVLRGVGFGCDEEVIRVIRNGPKWVATKRDERTLRDRVKVRVKFSLPKK